MMSALPDSMPLAHVLNPLIVLSACSVKHLDEPRYSCALVNRYDTLGCVLNRFGQNRAKLTEAITKAARSNHPSAPAVDRVCPPTQHR